MCAWLKNRVTEVEGDTALAQAVVTFSAPHDPLLINILSAIDLPCLQPWFFPDPNPHDLHVNSWVPHHWLAVHLRQWCLLEEAESESTRWITERAKQVLRTWEQKKRKINKLTWHVFFTTKTSSQFESQRPVEDGDTGKRKMLAGQNTTLLANRHSSLWIQSVSCMAS